MSGRKWHICWAVLYAFVAALDVATGVHTGTWLDYVAGGLFAAAAAFNLFLFFARQRKAESTVKQSPDLGAFQAAFEAQIEKHRQLAAGLSSPSPAPPKPADFHGLPFDLAVGEVYGMRMWRMDKYGRLYARNWKGTWRPGVNVAKCIKREWVRSGPYVVSTGDFTFRENHEHPAPSESCSCGFYAYTDSFHAETQPFTESNGEEVILGIIKGTGRTLIGTQGFRCEKAEIVALRDPTRGGTKTDTWRLRQLANLKRIYPDVPLLPSRAALLEFAPLTDTLPDPSTDEFWSLP